MKRAPAQEPCGIAAGLAAVGKNEVLNAKKIALNQQEFFSLPVAPLGQVLAGAVLGRILFIMPTPQSHRQRRCGFAVVVQRDIGLGLPGGGGGNGVGKTQPCGIKMIQPQRPVAAVTGGNVVQPLEKLFPQSGVFLLRGCVLGGFALFAYLRKNRFGRQRFQGIAPLQPAAGGLGCVRSGVRFKPDLLQQGEHSSLVMVASGVGFFVVFGGVVVGIEGFTLKTTRHTVGGGDDPLQQGVGLVVGGSGVDEAVGVHPVGSRAGLQLGTTDKGRHVAVDEVGRVPLDHIKRQGGVSGVDVAVTTALFADGAVQSFVSRQGICRKGHSRTLGKFAQIMQVGRQGHPTRGRQMRRRGWCFLHGHQKAPL